MTAQPSTRDDRVATRPSRPVLLDGYAARSCPVKTHNAFDPTVPIPPVESGGRLIELFDGASAFEAVILEELITSCRGRVVDLRLLAEHPAAERTRGLPGGDGVRRGGDHRRPAPGGRARPPGGPARPAGPGRRRAVRPPGLPPGRGQVAQDHRAGPATGHRAPGAVSGGSRRSLARAGTQRPTGGPLLHPGRPGTRRRPRPAGPRPAAGQPRRRLPPAGPLPPDAAGLWLRRRAGARRGDRHRRRVRSRVLRRPRPRPGGGTARPGAGLGRPGPAGGADVLPQPSRRLATPQPARALRLRARLPGRDRRGRRPPDRRPRDRPAAAGPPDRQRRVRPLPLVGALPAPARPRRRQPADRQGGPGLPGDRHPAPARHRHCHRPGRGGSGAPARLVPARGHPPQRRRGPDPHRGPPGPDAARRALVRPRDDADRSSCRPPRWRSTSTSRVP